MIRFTANFPGILDCFSLETLDRTTSSVYGLGGDLTLNYFNPAWFTFARENGGEPAISERFGLGTSIGAAIDGTASEYYLAAFESVMKTGRIWHHDYECSSPETFRLYHQIVYPLRNSQGIVIVNSLILTHGHAAGPDLSGDQIEPLYLQKNGFINQCSNCRRVQRVGTTEVWDWVPALVERVPDNVSHTFCEVCYDYYYAHNFRLG